MLLITELLTESLETLEESSSSGEKHQYIKGIFLQAHVKNRNGRIYPNEIMENAVNSYVNEVVLNNRGYGELGHPAGPQINLDRVSHLITELHKDGNNYIGKAKITDTPMGNIAKGLLKSGANLGVSSRGLGSLKPNRDGIMEVQDDFRIATAADIVADPSAPGAYVKGILEGVDWVYDEKLGWKANEYVYESNKKLKNNYKNLSEESKFDLFKKFLETLK